MANPLQQVSSRKPPPFPGTPRAMNMSKTVDFLGVKEPKEYQPDMVKYYLTKHPEVLDDYVFEHVTTERLNDWLYYKKVKAYKAGVTKADMVETVQLKKIPRLQLRYMEFDMVELQQALMQDVYEEPDILPVIHELAHVVGCGINAETFTMYVQRSGTKELCTYVPNDHDSQPTQSEYTLELYGEVGEGTTVACYVASCKKAFMLQDLLGDHRFPQGIGVDGNLHHSVLTIPVVLPTGDLICVVEFVRTDNSPQFGNSDLQIAVGTFSWVGGTMYQCQMNKTLHKQAELNEFLLQVSRVIFDDIIQMDKLVEEIMTYTKNLVNADRCALFLVDEEREEIYCNLLDKGLVRNNLPLYTKSDIRFPVSKGVAGYVARTGEIMNIKDPYGNQHFNRDVDKQTGYRTRNILCMPIISKGNVIGVVQMVNKKVEGGFTGADEAAFKMFSVYCALALHYSKVYTDLKKRTAQFEVAFEHLAYHVKCTDEEVKEIVANPLPDPSYIPDDLPSFFYTYNLAKKEEISAIHLPQLFIHMLIELCGTELFEMKQMCNFVMTVRKNYRFTLAYHNFRHGWLVAHDMYTLLLKIKDKIPPIRILALMVASLSHDVDHRGYTNSFLQNYNEPLAQLYGESTMEQHHAAHTISILQVPANNFFGNLVTNEEYRVFIGLIHQFILYTDLNAFLKDKRELLDLVKSRYFVWEKDENLEAACRLLLTASDLMVMNKTWTVQLNAINALYAEYHLQGDTEKRLGRIPQPEMDRETYGQLPKYQVEFMKAVCYPLYRSLATIVPDMETLVESCRKNLDQWQRIADGKSAISWDPSRQHGAL